VRRHPLTHTEKRWGYGGIVADTGIEVGISDFSDLLFERWVGGRLPTATAESRCIR